jgi:choice-of-anchor B domain-containing protein
VKVYDNHAFIVSEIDDSGMQVFDLRRLRDESGILDADAFYGKLSNTHNIAINEETGFAYAVGNTGGLAPPLTTDPEPCESSSGEGGGLHMIDVRQPKNPQFAGCAIVDAPFDPENNYVHDVECVLYEGPDAEHNGDEICFGSNENAVVIYDVTDKANPQVLSQTSYPTAAYTHQGVVTEDRQFFVFGDELDEGVVSNGGGGTVDRTTTYIMSIADLEAPGAPNAHTHETRSIDHNMYVHKGRLFQSNYAAGLRIHEYDNDSLSRGELNEVAYFDFLPGVDVNEFAGTWSNYPYFKSGIVVVSAIEEQQNGLLVLRPRLAGRGPAPTLSGDDDDGGGGGGGGSGTAGDGAAAGGGGGGGGGGACTERLDGTKASERLKGSGANEQIRGRRGSDTLKGKGGNDCLNGGKGRDRVSAGGGDDRVKGGRGRDRLRCGAGEDVAYADSRDRVAKSCEAVK